MTEHEASRTLVKSPPELWAECSDGACLARHLGEFGEIKITRLEPETTVDWEGERVSGTVRIEQSGWGTRVTLTAREVAEPEVQEPEEAAAPDEALTSAPATEPRPGAPATESGAGAPARESRDHAAAPITSAPARPRGFLARLRALFDPVRPAESQPAPDHFPAHTPTPPETAGPAPATEADPVAPVKAAAVHMAALEAAAVPVAAPEAAPPVTPTKEPQKRPLTIENEALYSASPVTAIKHDPAPVAPTEDDAAQPRSRPADVLTAALDSLGQAHHRPFSRG